MHINSKITKEIHNISFLMNIFPVKYQNDTNIQEEGNGNIFDDELSIRHIILMKSYFFPFDKNQIDTPNI